LAGRRDHRSGDAGEAAGLTAWTRRGALGAGLALPFTPMAQAAAAAVDVPIRMDENMPWTPVWLDGQGPFRFRVASSSNVFHVSEALAKRLSLEIAAGQNLISNGRYNRKVTNLYRVKQMVVGGELPLTEIRLIPMGGDDENEPSYPGTIPIPSDRITSFEWNRGLMRYSPELPAEAASYGKVPLRHSDIKLGWMPKVDCRIAGKPVRLSLNTSSPYGVTLHPDAVKRLGFWDGPGPAYERPGAVRGRVVQIRMARRGDLQLGGLNFERPVLGMYDPAEVLMDRNENDDGTIGMDVLHRVDLIFDPKRDMSWMRPTAAMTAPWRYDRAGFQIGMRDGVRRFVRIDPGSPAERAGLLMTDAINLTNAGILQLLAAQHAPAGTKLDIPIRRNGVPQRVSVVLEERL
jgi:hypothetical protein